MEGRKVSGDYFQTRFFFFLLLVTFKCDSTTVDISAADHSQFRAPFDILSSIPA